MRALVLPVAALTAFFGAQEAAGQSAAVASNELSAVPPGAPTFYADVWDNSAENRYKPDPSKNITWGLPTHAEMSQGYMQFRRLREVNLVVGDLIPESYGSDEELNEAN